MPGPRSWRPARPAQIGRLKVVALDPAVAPGDVTVEVTDAGGDSPTEDMFKLLIKVRGEVVEEFDRASFGRGKQNVVTMVNAVSKTVQLEDTGSGAVERLAAG